MKLLQKQLTKEGPGWVKLVAEEGECAAMAEHCLLLPPVPPLLGEGRLLDAACPPLCIPVMAWHCNGCSWWP